MTSFGQNTLALALARISAALDHNDLEQAVLFIAALYSVRSIAFLGTGIVQGPAEPLLAVTYASEWVEHYKRQRYAAIDPVIQEGSAGFSLSIGQNSGRSTAESGSSSGRPASSALADTD